MKSILFNTDMVCAIQEDRKTVTRRVVKGAGPDWDFVGIEKRPYERRVKADGSEYPKELDWPHAAFSAGDGYYDYPMIKTPCRPGDILYVRETWQYVYDLDGNEQPIEGTGRYLYAADNLQEPFGFWVNPDGTHRDSMPWRPSIHMPQEAARIFLRVADVRVERLQDITAEQVLDEGVEVKFPEPKPGYVSLAYAEMRLKPAARRQFADLWDSTIKPADRALYGWEANPWVWVIEFERCERPGAAP